MAPKHSAFGAMPGHSQSWTAILGVVVRVVMTVMAMMPPRRERGARTNQQQKSGKDELLHAMKIARFRSGDMPRKNQESRPLRVKSELGPRRGTSILWKPVTAVNIRTSEPHSWLPERA